MKGQSTGLPSIGYPALIGLEKAGIAGKYIAGVTHVSASTVSKWRTGNSVMPQNMMIFLTLVLANVIEDMEALERRLGEEGCAWNDRVDDQRYELQRLLREQEIYNAAILPEIIREGAGLFRKWLETNDAVTGTMTTRNDYYIPDDQIAVSAAE